MCTTSLTHHRLAILYFPGKVRAIGCIAQFKADNTGFGDSKDKGRTSVDAQNEIRPLPDLADAKPRSGYAKPYCFDLQLPTAIPLLRKGRSVHALHTAALHTISFVEINHALCLSQFGMPPRAEDVRCIDEVHHDLDNQHGCCVENVHEYLVSDKVAAMSLRKFDDTEGAS
jgi:hypothetical protein